MIAGDYYNKTAISTRQKIGSLAKKVLRFLYESRTRILKFSELLQETQKILKELKKSVDVICFYQAIGLVTRVSPDQYVYTGFRGISARLMEFDINRRKNIRATVQFEEVEYEGKNISIRTHLLAGIFFNEVFFGVIYPNGKFTSKGQIEMMVEDFSTSYKDTNTKTFLPDVMNILSMLGFIEKNENTEGVSYIGPDLRVYDEETFKKNLDKTQALLKKEEAFFTDVDNQQPQGEPINIEQPAQPAANTTNHAPASAQLAYLPELSFAILKAKNWEFPIKKTCTIIGRGSQRGSWQVDLDLPYSSVSRQHAVILYNFEVRKWEIRCLSRKNLIKVDGERYAFRDKDIWLRDRSVIEVGTETMMFCMLEKDE